MKFMVKTVFFISLFASGLFLLQCERIDIFEKAQGGEGQALNVVITGDNFTDENGKQTTLDVKLSHDPVSVVTIAVSSSDTQEGIVTSAATFDLSDTTAQSVTIEGQNDSEYENGESYTIVFSATSTDPDFNGKTASVTLENRSNDRYIFMASSMNGNLGGITGADSLCNSTGIGFDAAYEYKALIVDGVERVASVTDGQKDWVLLANGDYYRTDKTFFLSTDNNGYLTGTIGTPLDSGGFSATGLAADWGTEGETCSRWTDSGSAVFYRRGSAAATNIVEFLTSPATTGCGVGFYIYCVQAP